MPVKSYPFIDIAVHEQVRAHFARGDAAVLFSPDMNRVLWSNGEGALLFGQPSIYDFIDAGANPGDAAYRQLETAARQLQRTGDRRNFLMRVGAGFRSVPVNASVELIAVRPGETAILFACPHAGRKLNDVERAARMISGFDDPDTHMAVLDGNGEVLAASRDFDALAMTQQVRRTLVTTVAHDTDWLLKRPVPTGRGNLPAAIGKLSDEPALHILFAVETILGNLDPDGDFEEPAATPLLTPAPDIETPLPEVADEAVAETPADLIGDIGSIEDIPAEAESFTVDEAGDMVAETLPAAPQFALETKQPTADVFERTDAPVTTDDTVEEQVTATENEESAFVPDNAATAPAVIEDTLEDLTDEVSEEVPFDDAVEGVADNAGEPEGQSVVETPEEAPDAAGEPASEVAVENESGVAKPVEDAVPVLDGHAVDAMPEVAQQDDDPSGFVFDRNSRAVRFVWKIDADGRFSEISEEFAAAIGPRSADVSGQSFTDLAARYNLDPDNTIGDLLKRRDTWSGKTILWPVEGERLRVPVDLAALPTYSRSREFDGFRGFGIVRIADAVADATVVDFAAVETPAIPPAPDVNAAEPAEALSEEAVAPVSAETDAEDAVVAAQTGDVEADEARTDDADIAADAGEQTDDSAEDGTDIPEDSEAIEAAAPVEEPTEPSAVEEDPFRGERPALRLVSSPERPASEKIVDLNNHRQQGAETLTRSEQAAFKEIARQLGESFGKRPNSEVPERESEEGQAGETTAETPVAQIEDATATPVAEEKPDVAALVPARTRTNSGLTPEVLDNLPLALLVHSGDTLFHANPEFLSLTGYESLDALSAEGGIDALFADGDEPTELPEGSMQVIRRDGRLIPVSARLQSIRWEDTNALMMALSRIDAPASEPDVTAIPEIEETDDAASAGEIQALRMETEELHSILETATDGVVVVGSDGEIRSLNRSASALFNYDEADIRGKPFAMLFAHESQKSVLDYLGGLSGHGVASVLNDGREVIGREASGGFIPLFMTMGRLSSSNGFCAVIRDITQWKRTEEELRNAKRAAETANAHKSEFLARVSHEIRTPLNAIIGFSDMMASEHFGPIGNPRYVEYASDIGRSGRHVLDIVNDLLDISKIEAGEMDLDFTAVELNDAVSEAVALVQPQANSQRVIIRTSLSGSVPDVVADNRSIKQIALNILANAIRFTPSGGQIVVSTAYEANGSVNLRIRDTGVGMTRSELEQALKPFRQVTTGARKRGDGTGLGLPLTKAMVEANRAYFSITSAPNEGTLVEISFPPQRVLAN